MRTIVRYSALIICLFLTFAFVHTSQAATQTVTLKVSGCWT
jgi:hypothetical protein